MRWNPRKVFYSRPAQAIDLTQEYPCPVCRRGHLFPITLTEALGCGHCQRIYTVEDGGYTVLAAWHYTTQRQAWRWTGQCWLGVYSRWWDIAPLLISIVLVALLMVWLILR